MKRNIFKEILPFAVAIVIFIVLAVIYCFPVIDGKVVYQPDIMNFKGMSKEVVDFREQTGEEAYWTNSMFSGMPAYQISAKPPSSKWLQPISVLFHTGFHGAIAIILGYFIGFFVLMRSFKVNKWLSIVGAIAISLSSYFFIIIAAGHNSKAETIAFMAPVLAGFVLMFRKKYLWGVPLTMLFTAIGLMRHPQMSYYYFMVIGVFAVAELCTHIKEKRLKDYFIALLLFCAAVGIGAGTGYGKYKANNEYLAETMRGGHSEIEKNDEQKDNAKGLSLEYATQWSYGLGETMTLMIPDFYGGSSSYSVGTDSDIYKQLVTNGVPKRSAKEFCSAIPLYWGDQPFTSGPVYVGAIICFLFVLGLFIVKGPYKWAILFATIMSILLAWGHNFMGFTKFFFDYFPMYDKFRAVSSILVVAEVMMPLLAVLAIKEIMDKKTDKKAVLKSIYISTAVTAGICLFFALFGKNMMSFNSVNDAQMFAQLPDWLSQAIVAERANVFTHDAYRSMLFILLGAMTVWLLANEKLKSGIFIPIIGVLILLDMWPVDKRFFNDDNFVSKKEQAQYFKKLPYEEKLLQDPDPNFRVLNLTTNTFNDARTSYYLKSIGGYHGAKLRRYQDLIDQHISKNNFDVLNMLNMKYVIVKDGKGGAMAQYNSEAFGNCWFVDTLLVVDTPLEESDALNVIDLKTTAAADAKFSPMFVDLVTPQDSTASIKLTSYAPNELVYGSVSSIDKTAVFSEIYYPFGWKAYIDGQPVEHFRVNYVLRALNVPAGQHEVVFKFLPDSIIKGDKVSMCFVILMYLIVIGAIIYPFIVSRKK
ncbi:MAG: YfhO family protein [Bacteroidales bacterium]|nr:YfhO family protein [Bacteroidales bacterium]